MTDQTKTKRVDDGGPAFPQSEILREDGAELVREQFGGMSVRQWVAGSTAPQLFLRIMAENPDCTVAENARAASVWAFCLADAFIAASKSEG